MLGGATEHDRQVYRYHQMRRSMPGGHAVPQHLRGAPLNIGRGSPPLVPGLSRAVNNLPQHMLSMRGDGRQIPSRGQMQQINQRNQMHLHQQQQLARSNAIAMAHHQVPLKARLSTLAPKDLKALLQKELGIRFGDYWASLQRFLVGKMTKIELDNTLKTLPKNLLMLHNSFILSLLRSTYKSLANPGKIRGRLPSNRSSPYSKHSMRARRQTRELLVLKSRMEKIGKEVGLEKVTNEAVTLVYKAMEQHLASWFASISSIPVRKVPVEVLPPPAAGYTVLSTTKTGVITERALLESVNLTRVLKSSPLITVARERENSLHQESTIPCALQGC